MNRTAMMNVGREIPFLGVMGLVLLWHIGLVNAQQRHPPPGRVALAPLIPISRQSGLVWRYTFDQPGDDWFKADFDDSAWKQGPAGFGEKDTPGAVVRTPWKTADIWLRRSAEVPAGKHDDLRLLMHHDDDAEVYVNGVLAAKVADFTTDYHIFAISNEAKAALKPGRNVLAVHCHQTVGGQYIDVGIVSAVAGGSKAYAPPAVPLVTHDPYLSIWSCADRLTDDWPRHWTLQPHSLTSMARIDSRTYRLMGMPDATVPAMPQAALEVLPTRTIYRFEVDGVRITLTFTTPALPHDPDVLSRPLTYLTWDAAATDGKTHAVSIYYDNSAELAVDNVAQEVVWSREKVEGLTVLRMGSREQDVLGKVGDRRRIDWGYVYAAAPKEQVAASVIAECGAARKAFAADGSLPSADDADMPRSVRDRQPVAAFRFDLGPVANQDVSRTLMLAYDDLYSIEFLNKRLRPYWRRSGLDAPGLLSLAAKEFDKLRAACEKFDRELTADLVKAGGGNYAKVATLAYRQALAGCKLAADDRGRALMFPKENTSNGCIATVDVHYPASPLFLLFNPSLLEAQLTPVLTYAELPRWKHPFAPHDLGTYPKANAQVYGGGERTERNQMPVEESGNMLLMIAAICKVRGNASYAERHWPVLSRWAEYLRVKGFDPENQLCTDDFAGHLAHNVNLSAKAIVALGSYAMLCEMLGKDDQARAYRSIAGEFARRWVKEADDGDHYRLTFDKPGTWSQKYNLVWDRILGLRLFPPEVARKEIAFYRKTQKTFGLPLDCRSDYTKLDWVLWSASLGDSREDFEALVAPVADFLARTPDRVPMTDWYWTTTGRTQGMFARPVIGGVFIRMLYDGETWGKWAGRGKI